MQEGQRTSIHPPASLAAPAPPVPDPEEEPTLQSYVVRPGDTLATVARRAYGRAARWREIFEANRERLSGSEELRPGQVLLIP
jgi:nucleoid-associated protein YgaU